MVIPGPEIKQSKNAPFNSGFNCLRRHGQWCYVHNFGFNRGCENNLYLKISKIEETNYDTNRYNTLPKLSKICGISSSCDKKLSNQLCLTSQALTIYLNLEINRSG